MENITDFLFEIGILSRIKRTGFYYLGSGSQSVSEHSFRVAIIGYCLARMLNADVDVLKTILMCLLHDVPEARTGDLNYVNKRYVNADEEKSYKEMLNNNPYREEIKSLLIELSRKESIESKICSDSDQLEMILSLKEELDRGNSFSSEWIPAVFDRLILNESKKLAESIIKTPSYSWWMKLL